MVRITRNDAALDVANGDRFRVEQIALGRVQLSDGLRKIQLPVSEPLHVDHAYATTFHSSQGRTTDRVLIEAESDRKTTAKDTFYVALSRARTEARVYTARMQISARQYEAVKSSVAKLD